MLIFAYVILLYLVDDFSIKAQYNIYDDLYSDANFLLPFKREPNETDADYYNLTTTQAAERWRLDDDPQGMKEFLQALRDMNYLSLGSFMYWIFQTLTCFMLLIRVLVMLRKNKRLAVITDTIVEAANDLFHFFIVFLFLQAFFSVCGLVLFGDHVEVFSSMEQSLYAVCFLSICGDYGRILEVTHFDSATVNTFAELARYLYCGGLVMVNYFLLLNFVLAIVGDSLAVVKEDLSAGVPTIAQDLDQIYRWFRKAVPNGWLRIPGKLVPILKAAKFEGITKSEVTPLIAVRTGDSAEPGKKLVEPDSSHAASRQGRRWRRAKLVVLMSPPSEGPSESALQASPHLTVQRTRKRPTRRDLHSTPTAEAQMNVEDNDQMGRLEKIPGLNAESRCEVLMRLQELAEEVRKMNPRVFQSYIQIHIFHTKISRRGKPLHSETLEEARQEVIRQLGEAFETALLTRYEEIFVKKFAKQEQMLNKRSKKSYRRMLRRVEEMVLDFARQQKALVERQVKLMKMIDDCFVAFKASTKTFVHCMEGDNFI
mmetsp:Transcript_3897/g.5194  ORF Transcript_3897/g.5194 Transcript_3897/m.5194 type:complete len:540 (+) Transcript_3897:1-1620(+)